MKWNLKKMWPAAAASLVAFTSVINAADDMQMRNLENRVTALEQRKGSNGMINPPANPKVKEGADLFITGEAIFWKAHQNGMPYAFESRDGLASPVNAEEETPRHRYNWGFKVGLGYVLPHDGWDLYANYTRWNGHKYSCHDCGDCDCSCVPGLSFPTYFAPCDTATCPNVVNACGKWKVRFNRLDLELGREFFVSKWLTLRPFMGLTGLILTQHYNIDYEGGNYVPAGQRFFHKMRNQYRGGGLRGGFNSQWDLAKDWSIYGNFALNLLYGKFEIDQRSFSRVTATGVETRRYQIDNHFRMTRPVTDLALGLQWEHAFADDSFFMNIHAGWEQHYFWGQNQFMRFLSNSGSTGYVDNQGDFALDGWVFGARFDF
jgi:hypothetical protein